MAATCAILLEPDDLLVRLVVFHGASVTADDAGCGTYSMLVYYAYFYEDSDRDESGLDEILVE